MPWPCETCAGAAARRARRCALVPGFAPVPLHVAAPLGALHVDLLRDALERLVEARASRRSCRSRTARARTLRLAPLAATGDAAEHAAEDVAQVAEVLDVDLCTRSRPAGARPARSAAPGGTFPPKYWPYWSYCLRFSASESTSYASLISLNFSSEPPASGWCLRASRRNAFLISSAWRPSSRRGRRSSSCRRPSATPLACRASGRDNDHRRPQDPTVHLVALLVDLDDGALGHLGVLPLRRPPDAAWGRTAAPNGSMRARRPPCASTSSTWRCTALDAARAAARTSPPAVVWSIARSRLSIDGQQLVDDALAGAVDRVLLSRADALAVVLELRLRAQRAVAARRPASSRAASSSASSVSPRNANSRPRSSSSSGRRRRTGVGDLGAGHAGARRPVAGGRRIDGRRGSPSPSLCGCRAMATCPRRRLRSRPRRPLPRCPREPSARSSPSAPRPSAASALW